MEFFRKAKSVQLKSYHEKYLLADRDGENVLQDRNETTKEAIWMVKLVDGFDHVVRLKSIHEKYLTASEDQKFLGVTGRKVFQSIHEKLDTSIEWEPIRDGFQVCLKTRYGNYLRANGGLPPWRNSVTHDIPYRHHDWILWDVQIVATVETRPEEPPPETETINPDLNSSSFFLRNPRAGSSEANDLPELVAAKNGARMVYYTVAYDDGNVDDHEEETSFAKGHRLDDLTLDLEEQTGIDDIIVCSKNPLSAPSSLLRFIFTKKTLI